MLLEILYERQNPFYQKKLFFQKNYSLALKFLAEVFCLCLKRGISNSVYIRILKAKSLANCWPARNDRAIGS